MVDQGTHNMKLKMLIDDYARNLDKIHELYPDVEKKPIHISNFEELAEVESAMNQRILDKLVELHSTHGQEQLLTLNNTLKLELAQKTNELRQSKDLNGKLVMENEQHVYSIETLGKQIELYKSRNPMQVDQKLAVQDSKVKSNARRLQNELKLAEDTVVFKEEKIKELNNEIERLKFVMKVEVELAREGGNKKNEIAGKDINKRIEDLSYQKNLVFPIIGSEENYDLGKIITIPSAHFIHSFGAQAKLLEDKLAQTENMQGKLDKLGIDNKVQDKLIEEYKQKYTEMIVGNQSKGKDQATLIAELKAARDAEGVIALRYNALVENITNLLKEGKIHDTNLYIWKLLKEVDYEEGPTIALTGSIDPSTFIGSGGLQKTFPVEFQDYEEVELILDEEEDNLPMQSKVQSFPEVGTRIKELLNNRQFKQAADLWKQYKYQILDLSPAENYNLLKIICKVRDKQIEGLKGQRTSIVPQSMKSSIDFKSEEVMDLIAEYESMKFKHNLTQSKEEMNNLSDIKQFESKLKEVQSELIKSDLLLNDRQEEIKYLKRQIKELEDIKGGPNDMIIQDNILGEAGERAMKRNLEEKDEYIAQLEKENMGIKLQIDYMANEPIVDHEVLETGHKQTIATLNAQISNLKHENESLKHAKDNLSEMFDEKSLKQVEWRDPKSSHNWKVSPIKNMETLSVGFGKQSTEINRLNMVVVGKDKKIEDLSEELKEKRGLVREILSKEGSVTGMSGGSKINEILYENYNEAKMKYNEVQDAQGMLVILSYDVSEEVRQIFKNVSELSKCTSARIKQLDIEDTSKMTTATELMEGSLVNLKNMSILVSDLLFYTGGAGQGIGGSQNGVLSSKKAPAVFEGYLDSGLHTYRMRANDIYKEFNSKPESRGGVSISELSHTIRDKNASFKVLFELFEELSLSYEQILFKLGREPGGGGGLLGSEGDGVTRFTLGSMVGDINTSAQFGMRKPHASLCLHKEELPPLQIDSKLQYMNKQLADAARDLQFKDEQLKLKARSIHLLDSELVNKELEIKDIRNLLDEVNKRVEIKNEENQGLRHENIRYMTQFEDINEQYVRLQSNQNADHDVTEIELRRLKDEMNMLKDKLTQIKLEQNNLRETKAQMQVKLIESEEELARLQNMMNREREEKNSLDQVLSDTKRHYGDRESLLQNEIHTIRVKLESSQGESARGNNYIRQYEKLVTKIQEIKGEMILMYGARGDEGLMNSPTAHFQSNMLDQLGDDYYSNLLILDEIKERLIDSQHLPIKGSKEESFHPVGTENIRVITQMSHSPRSPGTQTKLITLEKQLARISEEKANLLHELHTKKKPQLIEKKTRDILKTLINQLQDGPNDKLSTLVIDKLRQKELRIILNKCVTKFLGLKDQLIKKTAETLEAQHAQKRANMAMEEERNTSVSKEKYNLDIKEQLSLEFEEKITELIRSNDQLIERIEIINQQKDEFIKINDNLRIDIEKFGDERKFLEKLIAEYKGEIEQLMQKNEFIGIQNEDLTRFQRKANSQIAYLLENLKGEQHKQKSLSYELEALREHLKRLGCQTQIN